MSTLNLKRAGRIFVIFACLRMIFPVFLYAQNPVIEEIIEELAANSDNEDADYSSITEDLFNYMDNPLNLNDANVESLEKLHFLTEFQIESLLNYIAKKGEMKTIFELQLIDGFDFETINKILHFVDVQPKRVESMPDFKNIFKFGNHKLSAETKLLFQEQKGYRVDYDVDSTETPKAPYPGNNMKYLFRYRFSYKTKVNAGFTAEKDPGEKIEFENKKYGFDYNSAYVQLNDIGSIKSMVIGDYQVKYGQGLILWTGFGMGKSSEASNIRKKGQGIRYYSSTDENNFMRGAATMLKFGKITISSFFSRKKIDASTLDADTIENIEERISSLQNTGYHRTEAELANRKILGETITGASVTLGLEHFKAGLNFVNYWYDMEAGPSDQPYKLYDFAGDQNFNASVDYSYFANKFNLFGEAAVGKNGALAILNGMSVKVAAPISFSILHRYFQKDYQAYYASAFSENSRVNNEEGLYLGLVYHPFRKMKLSAYADAFRFPWLKYGVDAPSSGFEYMVQADYSLNRNISMYLRWKFEDKEDNKTYDTRTMSSLVNEKRKSYRYHVSCRVSSMVSLRTRVEYAIYSKDEAMEYGFMLFQDVNVDLKTIPLSFDVRYSVFNSTYNTRLYAYENDLLYNFSVPAYSGKGSRFYLMAKYELFDKLDIRARYSQFFYPGAKTLSSGLEEINGNLKSEFKLQMIIHF